MGLWSDSGLRFSAKAVALGPQGRLRAVGHVELAEDPREVRLHRLVADLQLARDELVGQSLDEQGEHLALALGQPGERVGLGARREDGARRARVQRRLAARGGADALGDLVGGGVLEQIAARARVDRGDDAAEAVADDAVVVGEQDADHAGTSSSTVVPSPGCERTLSVPPLWRTSSSSSESPTWPSSARRARSVGSKPRPSSRTTR